MASKKKSKKKPTRSTTAKTQRARVPAPKPKARRVAGKKSRPGKKTRSRATSGRRGRVSENDARTAIFDQAGDLRGLSRTEQADSESVEELAEEGNLFEAGAVAGVEQADDADEKEVHTHEVLEDDVPEEYLDKD